MTQTYQKTPGMKKEVPPERDLQKEILPQRHSVLNWGLREAQPGSTRCGHTAELPSPVLPRLTGSFPQAAIFQLERASRDRWYPLRALSCRNNWKLTSFLVIPCSGKALTDKTTVMLDFLWLQISLMGLEKRRRCGDFIAAFQYTKGASKQEGSQTFTVGVGTEGNSLMGVMVSCSEVDVLGGRRGFVAECGKSLCSFLKLL
eukprot:XP_025002225.1 uncharacterized protein LOC107051196 isoform X2 [Gallus gallus]